MTPQGGAPKKDPIALGVFFLVLKRPTVRDARLLKSVSGTGEPLRNVNLHIEESHEGKTRSALREALEKAKKNRSQS